MKTLAEGDAAFRERLAWNAKGSD